MKKVNTLEIVHRHFMRKKKKQLVILNSKQKIYIYLSHTHNKLISGVSINLKGVCQ